MVMSHYVPLHRSLTGFLNVNDGLQAALYFVSCQHLNPTRLAVFIWRLLLKPRADFKKINLKSCSF